MLTLIKRKYEKRGASKKRWYNLYQCSCGKTTIAKPWSVEKGIIKSCGCLNLKRNGMSSHPLYVKFEGILKRCYYPKNPSYRWYGAKGIGVCREWKGNPLLFLEWGLMNGWKHGLQIDRVDSTKDYSPDNCRFVTARENTLNMWEDRRARQK